jgi:hypothetical protein
MSNIDEIADGYVERQAALNPIDATFCGIAGHDDRLPDYGPDGFRAAADLARETIAALNAQRADDENEQVAKDAMVERLGLAVENYDAGEATSDLNVLASPLQAVRQVFDLMPVEGEEAQRNLAARMAAVPDAYAGLRRTLLESAKNGRAAARRQVIECAKQCAEWSGRPSTAAAGGQGEGAERAGFYGGLVARSREGAGRHRRVRRLPRNRAAALRAGAGRGGPRALCPGLALFPRRGGGPGRRLRLGLVRGQAAGSGDEPGSRAHRAGRHRGRRGGRARFRARPQDRRA